MKIARNGSSYYSTFALPGTVDSLYFQWVAQAGDQHAVTFVRGHGTAQETITAQQTQIL